jgi:dCMP deaminase
MDRIDRDTLFIEMAALVAKRGTCPRRQVGAVIVKDRRVVSMGYNGAPPGMPHCDEVGCGGGEMQPDEQAEIGMYYPNGCTRAIHAESNAIVFSARHGVPTDGATMYSTCATCATCAALVIASGIRWFVYAEEYRLTDGIDLLTEAGIGVEQWTP